MINIIEEHCKKLNNNLNEQNEKIVNIDNQLTKLNNEKITIIKNINYMHGALMAYTDVCNMLKSNNQNAIEKIETEI